MSLKRELPTSYISGAALSALLVLTILNVLLQNVKITDTDGFQLLQLNASEGVANAVTTVVVYFRGFDTLGEIAVLFTASLGVGLMLNKFHEGSSKVESNFMLQVGAKLLFPIILLYGIYVMVYGHLSPGGGFQGGVIVASGALLLLISHSDFHIPHSTIVFFETLSGVSYVIIGLMGLLMFDIFLTNILPNNIAQMGMLFSGGIIPIIYIVVGVKVGSEMSNIAQNMVKRRDDD
ncbi:MAG: hydrogen gas-evolving membrane-bound hydrogenase subunit E [Campylobacterota bacterium]|nr:hydrogen gas-evolving membrane-bound hydrogenase subunit E [Campylobacterota bacterium]